MPVTPLTKVSARPPKAPAATPSATAIRRAMAVAPATSSSVRGAAVSTCESTSSPWIVVPNGCDHDGPESRALSIATIEPSPGATSGPTIATPSSSASNATPRRAVRLVTSGASSRIRRRDPARNAGGSSTSAGATVTGSILCRSRQLVAAAEIGEGQRFEPDVGEHRAASLARRRLRLEADLELRLAEAEVPDEIPAPAVR